MLEVFRIKHNNSRNDFDNGDNEDHHIERGIKMMMMMGSMIMMKNIKKNSVVFNGEENHCNCFRDISKKSKKNLDKMNKKMMSSFSTVYRCSPAHIHSRCSTQRDTNILNFINLLNTYINIVD